MQEKAVAELDPVLTKTGFTKAVEMMYEDMGTQMAKTLGVEKFGGNVQTSGVKKVGYSYWCTANKDMYRCKVENSLNYVDDAYFDAFSNASLLGKLKNLFENENYILETKTNSSGTSVKYVNGVLEFKPSITTLNVSGTYPIPFKELRFAGGTYACSNTDSTDEVTISYTANRSKSFTNTNVFDMIGTHVIGIGTPSFNKSNELNLVIFTGRWK